jgi:protein arginine kinase
VIEKIVSSPASGWTGGEGPHGDIVISSRIRLARNLDKLPMPPFQNETSSYAVLERVKKAAESLELEGWDRLHFYRMDELPSLQKQILLEKHLISREHAENRPNKGLLVSENESVSIMINEEDHIRIQVILTGLQLEEAWEKADKVDDLLESRLEYAFDEERGYLTCCPTNAGTGLRASVMVHLPALTATRQASRIFSALGQLGLVVRGLYGEGTEATGYIFQVSNQITLGQKESEIIQNLASVTRQIIEKEEETRKILLKETPLQVEDRVGRAYGILTNAATLSSQEALNLLSDIRLGVSLGLLKINLGIRELNELMVSSQPGFLQSFTGKDMEAAERDAARAKLFKEKLNKKRG